MAPQEQVAPVDEDAIDDAETNDAEIAEYEVRRRERREAAIALVTPLAPDLAERIRTNEDEESQASARASQGHVLVSFSWAGNGVDGGWGTETTVIGPDGARLLTVDEGGTDGQYVTVATLGGRLSTDAARAAFRAFVGDDDRWLERDGDSDAARARLFLTVEPRPRRAVAGDVTIVGPLYGRADTVAGPVPEGPCGDGSRDARRPGLYLAPSVLRGRDLRVPPWFDDEGNTARRRLPSMVRIAPVALCGSTTRYGAHELRAYAMAGRNRGHAIALYDHTTDQHRWVLETRYAVLGSRIDWLGVSSGVALGRYASEHPGYLYEGHAGIVAIRLRDGAAFRIDVAGAFADDLRVRSAEDAILDAEDARLEACLEGRVAARGVMRDDVTEEDETACNPTDLEIAGTTLRARRDGGEWVEVDLEELARRIDRAR